METKHIFRFSLRTLLLAVVAVSVGTAAMVSASIWWQTGVLTLTVVLLVGAILLAAFRSGSSRAFWTGFAVSGCAYLLTLIVQIDNQRVADQLLPAKLLHLMVEVMHKIPTGPYGTNPPMTYVPTPATYYAPVPAYATPVPAVSAPLNGPVPPNEATPSETPDDPPGCGEEDVTPDQAAKTPVADEVYQPVPNSAFPVPANPPMIVPPSIPMTYYGTPAYGVPVMDDIYTRQQRCLTIGHCLTALLFGMIGGCFAVWLHATRDGRKKAATENVATPAVNA